jgi:putative lipoprotein
LCETKRAHAQDAWLGPDKALHFGVSAGLAAGGYALSSLVLEKPWQRASAGAGFALSAGVAKELWDLSGRGDPSFKDLAWDGVGTAVGVGLALALDVWVFRAESEHGQRQATLLLRW